MARAPHFRTPFRVADGAPVEIEQDTPAEFGQCITAVLRTPEESLLDKPAFGRPDEAFAQEVPNPDAVVYLSAVERWEPRARVMGEAFVQEEIKRIVVRQEGQ